jgi:hypothetical protein
MVNRDKIHPSARRIANKHEHKLWADEQMHMQADKRTQPAASQEGLAYMELVTVQQTAVKHIETL